MKTLAKLYFILASALFSMSSLAVDLSAQSITKVYVNDAGRALIKASGHTQLLQLGYFNDDSPKYLSPMYSLALAAKMSQQSNVWIRYVEVEGDYPRVTIMSVE